MGPVKEDGPEEKYRTVKFLTPTPLRGSGIQKFMSFNEVVKLLGKTFFWARTIKVPYLSREDSEKLLEALKKIL